MSGIVYFVFGSRQNLHKWLYLNCLWRKWTNHSQWVGPANIYCIYIVFVVA